MDEPRFPFPCTSAEALLREQAAPAKSIGQRKVESILDQYQGEAQGGVYLRLGDKACIVTTMGRVEWFTPNEWGGIQPVTSPAIPSLIDSEIAKDTARLDFVMNRENRHLRVQGDDVNGWCVLDCGNGLEFIVRHANTYREAIDRAIEKKVRGEG